jgi:glycosyltransferase involved in cell wall biosynthesis
LQELIRFFGNYPLEFAGGGEICCSAIANHVGQHGFRVEYISSDRPPPFQRITEEQARFWARSFSYYRSPFHRYSLVGSASLYRPLPPIEQLRESQVNLVLLDRIPPAQFLLALQKIRTPTVLLFTGITLEAVLPPNPLAACYEMYVRAAMRSLALLSGSPHVFFQVFTARMGQAIEKCAIDEKRVVVIPNGVDFSKIPEPTESDRFTVTFVGRLEGVSKGLDFLVRVLKRLDASAPQDLEVNILGSGENQSFMDEFSESRHIRFRGYVPEPDKVAMLSRSDVFLVTSYIEPFSLATVEALAGGAFVLTTPCSGPSSIVGASPLFGAVLRYRPQEFEREILRAYDRWNGHRRELVGERRMRRRRALTLYSMERMVGEYLELVRRLVNSS